MKQTVMEEKFKMSGNITLSKLLEYLPAALLSGFSSLLLGSIDGIVVGWFVSSSALASVSIFSPVSFIAGMVSVLTANGISVCLSVAAGKNDREEIGQVKAASRVLITVSVILIVVLQVAASFFIVSTYELPDDMKQLVWQYAIGMIIAAPFGYISTVGAYQLQVIGKVKLLAKLAVMEGVLNLVLDVLFVKYFNMGVAGAGFGTTGATTLRCLATVIVIMKHTNLLKTEGVKARLSTIKEILGIGLPYAANVGLLVVQSYLIILILIRGFGIGASIILGIANFCYGLQGVIATSVTDSMRPLVGLMTGAEDVRGLKLLIKQGLWVMMLLIAVLVAVIMVAPELFYHIFKVYDIPEGGLMSLRIYSLYFFVAGVNEILRLFMVNQKDTGFATMMPVIRTVTRLAAAYLFCEILPAPSIWFAYFVSEGIECFLNVRRYSEWIKRESKETEGVKILYLSVKPSEAVEASRMIRSYADSMGYPQKIAYRASLAMEEMVAYAKQAQEGVEVESQIVIRLSHDKAVFLMIDNGRQIVFGEDEEKAELVTDNYNLIKRIASSLEYQYLLNMNYTKMEFVA